MSIRTHFPHVAALFVCLLVIAACNTSNVSEGLAPTASTGDPVTRDNRPVPGGTVGNASAQPSNTQSANALAAAPAETPAQTAATNQAEPPAQTAALNQDNSFTFLPVTGAPQSAVTMLSKQLSQSANSNGLVLVPANQTGAKYQVKGYFSALNDGSGTLLVYVWDVLDGSGNRLHRINGQERSTETGANPWSGVTDVELKRVASATISQLEVWSKNR